MLAVLQSNWRTYLIEAGLLGAFMASACCFTIVLEYPDLPFYRDVEPFQRRMIMGLAMGLTAVLLIYSPWGKRSGAHMNPAVTLANLLMERISWQNGIWYIVAQFMGGTAAVLLFKWLAPQLAGANTVNYAATVPGMAGVVVAFLAEFVISALLLLAVLWCSNSRFAKLTGWLAGCLVALYISFEAPLSGMSMNPARTFASAFSASLWTGWWIYFTAPVFGMLMVGYFYRKNYRHKHGGNCLTMKCHLSGNQHDCGTYEVLGPADLLEKTKATYEKTALVL